MAAATGNAPTAGEYIIHHLTHLQNHKQTAIVDFTGSARFGSAELDAEVDRLAETVLNLDSQADAGSALVAAFGTRAAIIADFERLHRQLLDVIKDEFDRQGGAELAFEISGFSRDMVFMLQGLIVLFAGAMAQVAAPALGAT